MRIPPMLFVPLRTCWSGKKIAGYVCFFLPIHSMSLPTDLCAADKTKKIAHPKCRGPAHQPHAAGCSEESEQETSLSTCNGCTGWVNACWAETQHGGSGDEAVSRLHHLMFPERPQTPRLDFVVLSNSLGYPAITLSSVYIPFSSFFR